MKKLILEEEEIFQPEENEAETKQALDIASFTGLISSLIKDEWGSVDNYNQAMVVLAELGNDNITSTLADIVNEEYIHIGQLEKVLQMIIPEANAMKEGEQEAGEEITDIEEPEIEEPGIEESLDEELPEDDIPMDVADKVEFKDEEETAK